MQEKEKTNRACSERCLNSPPLPACPRCGRAGVEFSVEFGEIEQAPYCKKCYYALYYDHLLRKIFAPDRKETLQLQLKVLYERIGRDPPDLNDEEELEKEIRRIRKSHFGLRR